MHHKIIYGAPLRRIQKVLGDVIIESPFTIFKAPDRDAGEIGDYVGFEYGRVNGLFTDFRYTYDNKFTIADCTLPEHIKDIFKQKFPGVRSNTYALIQNNDGNGNKPVYSAKFVNGFVMTGFWVFCNEETKCNLIEAYHDGTIKLDVMEVGHNMAKNTPSDLFIGEVIDIIGDCEDCDSLCFRELAKKLLQTHTSIVALDRNDILATLSSIDKNSVNIAISEIPMTCVIEGMCYCCT